MDYSLLVGIHDVERAEQEEMDVEGAGEDEEFENDEMGRGVLTGSFGTPPDSPGNPLNCGGFFGPGEFDSSVDVYAIKSHDSAVKKEVYFMAIIDILTHYDAKKKAAHAAKTVKHGAGAEISTVNPEQYSKRFYEFMSNILS
ncbi:Phosphatidylinositol 5-phosphate 4-kinase type-2 beta [Ilyodon furcidens]